MLLGDFLSISPWIGVHRLVHGISEDLHAYECLSFCRCYKDSLDKERDLCAKMFRDMRKKWRCKVLMCCWSAKCDHVLIGICCSFKNLVITSSHVSFVRFSLQNLKEIIWLLKKLFFFPSMKNSKGISNGPFFYKVEVIKDWN